MGRPQKEYALYKGDEFIMIGTAEEIAINLSAEIERQKTNEDKVIKYLKDNISDYKVIQEVNRILRGE